jgi:N-acylneuraminate cytidylyltransferase
MTKNSIYEGNVKSVLIPKERAIDIDTIYDFELAEYLARNNIHKKVME